MSNSIPLIDKFLEISNPENLLKRPVERNEVDYKKHLNNSKKGNADLVMNTAAMANYGGGVLVFGVDGEELLGIDDTDLKYYDSASLQGILQKFLSPVPKVSCELVSYEDKKFPLLSVASIEASPILCCKELHDEKGKLLLRPGDIFIRQNTQTIKSHTEGQIRHILDQSINFEINRRLKEIYPIFEGLSQKKIDVVSEVEGLGRRQAKDQVSIEDSTPVREVLLVPKNENITFDDEKLKNAFRLEAHIHGHGYPHYATNSESSGAGRSKNGHIAWFGAGPTTTKEIWKTFVRQEFSGALYWVSVLFEDEVFTRKESQRAERFENAIGVIVTLYNIVLVVAHAKEYLKALGCSDEDEWELKVRFRNVSGRKLVVEDIMRGQLYSSRQCLDDEVESTVTVSLKTLEEDKKQVATEILSEIYKQFNWAQPNLEQISKDLDESFAKTYVSQEHLNGLTY